MAPHLKNGYYMLPVTGTQIIACGNGLSFEVIRLLRRPEVMIGRILDEICEEDKKTNGRRLSRIFRDASGQIIRIEIYSTKDMGLKWVIEPAGLMENEIYFSIRRPTTDEVPNPKPLGLIEDRPFITSSNKQEAYA